MCRVNVSTARMKLVVALVSVCLMASCTGGHQPGKSSTSASSASSARTSTASSLLLVPQDIPDFVNADNYVVSPPTADSAAFPIRSALFSCLGIARHIVRVAHGVRFDDPHNGSSIRSDAIQFASPGDARAFAKALASHKAGKCYVPEIKPVLDAKIPSDATLHDGDLTSLSFAPGADATTHEVGTLGGGLNYTQPSPAPDWTMSITFSRFYYASGPFVVSVDFIGYADPVGSRFESDEDDSIHAIVAHIAAAS